MLEKFKRTDIVFNPKAKGSFKRKAWGEFWGSKFRGVSKNGKQWQVFIMIGKWKWYIGITGNEEDAAWFYDKLAIKNHGTWAKTNFSYTKRQVEQMLHEDLS